MRKNIRLEGFDYRASYWYFVTVCTRDREELFIPRLSPRFDITMSQFVAAGPWPAVNKTNTNTVEDKLLLIEQKFDRTIDYYCFMPDHLHFIVGQKARQGRAATKKTSLSWIINAFKGWCTREFYKPIWQPNYYEHIIRDEASLDKIRKYIAHNPLVTYDRIPWKRLDPNV